MKILSDAEYTRIASTLDGYVLLGFQRAHVAAGGRVPPLAKSPRGFPVSVADQLFSSFDEIFGGH